MEVEQFTGSCSNCTGQVDPVTGVPDMFTASYYVNEMRVLASEARLYGKEAVKVGVKVDLLQRELLLRLQTVTRSCYLWGRERFHQETSVFKVSRTLR